ELGEKPPRRHRHRRDVHGSRPYRRRLR
ncbi:MAG: N-methylhydantoinase A, partial [uncultured Rubrobacteraceae bacterium]